MKKTKNPQTLSNWKDLCNRMGQIRVEVEKLQATEDAEDDYLLSETCENLFIGILNIADYCCGDVDWADIRQFLEEAGVSVPADFDKSMKVLEG